MEWNAGHRAQQAQRAQQLERERANAAAEEQARRRRALPFLRDVAATRQRELDAARAALTEAERHQAETWAAYARAYFVRCRGTTPTGPTGQPVLLVPLPGMSAEALSELPVREWEAHEQAVQRWRDANARVLRLEAALRDDQAQVAVCRDA